MEGAECEFPLRLWHLWRRMCYRAPCDAPCFIARCVFDRPDDLIVRSPNHQISKLLSSAGRGYDTVHAQVFHHLPVFIAAVDDGLSSDVDPGHLGAAQEGDLLQYIVRSQSFGGAMSHRERVLQERDDFRLGLQFVRTIGAFNIFRHLVAAQGAPEAEIGGGGVLDERCKGAYIFECSTRDVEAGRSEIEFVFGHGFSGLNHQLFIAADLPVYNRSESRSRLLRLLGLGSAGSPAGGRITALRECGGGTT